MTLSDISIERPVLTWMLTLALATFGVLGLGRLGLGRRLRSVRDGMPPFASYGRGRSHVFCFGIRFERFELGDVVGDRCAVQQC